MSVCVYLGFQNSKRLILSLGAGCPSLFFLLYWGSPHFPIGGVGLNKRGAEEPLATRVFGTSCELKTELL